MTVTLATDHVLEALNLDPEFVMTARHWTTNIKLFVGDDPYFIDVVDGTVTRFSDTASGFDTYSILIGGPVDAWERILAEVPKPFYQDFWSAFMRHDFTLDGDLKSLYPYHPALRRMSEILRSVHNQEA